MGRTARSDHPTGPELLAEIAPGDDLDAVIRGASFRIPRNDNLPTGLMLFAQSTHSLEVCRPSLSIRLALNGQLHVPDNEVDLEAGACAPIPERLIEPAIRQVGAQLVEHEVLERQTEPHRDVEQ